jgi:RHS repeat-associated protein
VYNDEPYYFIKNLQGDVIAITDRSGIVVARYSYDAWGVCTIEQDSAYCIGGINPYRYRGYYYDSEIGMYYLQSRYYDPAVGRFVNADEAMFGTVLAKTVVAHNLFVYCYNTPVKMLDFYGYEGVLIAGVFIVLIVLFAYFSIVRITTNPKVQDIWRNWCKAISDRLNEIWNKVTILFQSAASIVEKAVAKNVEKAKAVLRTKKHQEYYWIASKVTFKVRGKVKTTYFPCMPISKKNAAPYIRAQGNVFASSQIAAKSLAASINGSPPVGPEIHGGGVGYFWHYHARKRVGAGQNGGHIFLYK